MSLQTRLEALVAAIGADIKSIRASVLGVGSVWQQTNATQVVRVVRRLAVAEQTTDANLEEWRNADNGLVTYVNEEGLLRIQNVRNGKTMLRFRAGGTSVNALEVTNADGSLTPFRITQDGTVTSSGSVTASNGLYDGANRAYSDSNPPETLVHTVVASAPATPASGFAVFTVRAKQFFVKFSDGVENELLPYLLNTATAATTNPDRMVTQIGGVAKGWLNEWGAIRGTSPYSWGDALVRGIRANGDGITAGNAIEMEDRRTGAVNLVMYGRRWADGRLVRNGNVMADVFVVAKNATPPTSLPDGTVIVELAV